MRVGPVRCGVPKVAFKTLNGTPTLILATLADGRPVPMGAEVKDSEGNSIGMAGQNGQIYARLPNASGTLFVSWGSHKNCRINYQLPASKADDNSFVRLNGTCVQ